MKKTRLFYTTIIGLALSMISCQSDDSKDLLSDEKKLNSIEIVNNKIDLKNDNISDFELEEVETATLDIPSSYGLIEKMLFPLNEYELLTDNNWNLITLNVGDIVKKTDFENKKHLKSSPITLLKKERHFDIYDEKWSINQGVYIVFKNETEIGWLLFDLDVENGQIKIIDHKTSEDNFITIN